MNKKELTEFVGKLAEKYDLIMFDEEAYPTPLLSTKSLKCFVEDLKSVEVFKLDLFEKEDGKYFGGISFINEYCHSRDCSVSEIYDHSAVEELENLIDELLGL